jgi:RNA polymerase sigma factor (sigma-70 family)
MEIHSPPDTQPASDVLALYRRCSSDDPSACNPAFQELGCFLLRIACARIKGQPHLAAVAEDCTQQALVIIWRKLRAGCGPARPEWFTTWCAGIVIHRVLDELRKVTRAQVDSLDELAEGDENQLPLQGSPNVPADTLTFATADDRRRFIALIESHPHLSPDAKLVLLHGFLLEQDDQELAQQLGKSRATVRVLRFRGIKTLREDREFMAQVMSLTHADLPSMVTAAAV